MTDFRQRWAALRKHHLRPCAVCGETFQPKSATTKYCSYRCAGRAQRKLHPKPCGHCGEMFTPRAASTKYCSRVCSGSGSAAYRNAPSRTARKKPPPPAPNVTSVAIKLAPPCACLGEPFLMRSLDVGADYRTVWTCYRCGRATR